MHSKAVRGAGANGRSRRNRPVSGAAFWTAFGAAAMVCALAGCGNTYRPVVSAINPVGPAAQPTKYAVAVSKPTSGGGLVTFVDVAGDSILSTPAVFPTSQAPSFFTTDFSGTTGYVLNPSGVFETFSLGSPSSLISSDITPTQLAAGAGPVSVSAFALGGTQDIFIPEPSLSTPQVAVLTNPGSPSLVQSLSVGSNPVYVVGADASSRAYAISQGAAGSAGQVAAIESSPVSISATIPVGMTPVYGVMTPDDRRAFILNKGSGTVSVLNVVSNTLDVTTPTITLPNIPSTNGTPNPVWADLSPRLNSVAGNNQLVVLNQGDGVHGGTLTIINIPLCNSSAQIGNPNCNAANPVDATGPGGFGTISANVTVGVNPVMVSVLQDGTRAYVVNAGNATTPGSINVVNLISGLVTATIVGDSTNTVSSAVWGHPNSVAATMGTPTGKVYVTSSDSQYMTVLRTDLDTVETHINLQGTGLRVMVTAP